MLEYFKPYYSTARNLLKYRNNDAFEIFKSEYLSENYDYHDGLYGGIDYVSIVLSLPTSKYVEMGDVKIKEIVDTITKAFEEATHDNDSLQINGIRIVPHDYDDVFIPTSESMWTMDYFRLFISHLTENKISAANLQTALYDWGIHGFVAHQDIEPTKEWEKELYNALFSMDALCAILAKGFVESKWCDQEIGIAFGQNKLCIPIHKEINPHGFLGRYQVLKPREMKANCVAKQVAETIYTSEKTHSKYCSNIVRLLLNSKSVKHAKKWLNVIKHFERIEKLYIEMVWKDFSQNLILLDESILTEANNIFSKYGLQQINPKIDTYSNNEVEELPF